MSLYPVMASVASGKRRRRQGAGVANEMRKREADRQNEAKWMMLMVLIISQLREAVCGSVSGSVRQCAAVQQCA